MYGGQVRAWQGAPDDGYWELYTDTDALDIMVPPVMSAYSQLYEVWDAGGCTLRCDGAWAYVFGGLEPERDAEALIEGARLLARAGDGILPWRGRPEILKRGLIARMPPLDFTEETE